MASYDEKLVSTLWDLHGQQREALDAWSRETATYACQPDVAKSWAIKVVATCRDIVDIMPQYDEAKAKMTDAEVEKLATDAAIKAACASSDAAALREQACALTAAGRNALAASKWVELAEVKSECGDATEALFFYETAAKLYKADGAKARYLQCLQSIARIYTLVQSYAEAIAKYEEIVKVRLADPLLKHGVEKHCLLLLECCMATSMPAVVLPKLALCRMQCPILQHTREHQFVVDLMYARTENEYGAIVRDYEAASPLAPVEQSMIEAHKKLRMFA